MKEIKLTKKEESYLKKTVKLCISFIVIYTIISIVLFSIFNIEMGTLTTCVYSFFGAELCLTAFIKIFGKNEENELAFLNEKLNMYGQQIETNLSEKGEEI